MNIIRGLKKNIMNKISVAFALSYGTRGAHQKYVPLMNVLGTELCNCYGLKFPKGYIPKDEPTEKMYLSSFADIASRHIVSPLSNVFHYPQYYSYMSKNIMFDYLISNRVSKDNSRILFTSPLLENTVRKAKQSGKIVVLEAGNSEPEREHKRIKDEYEKFHIKNRYIYGDSRYRDICKKSFELADKIITISNVSKTTYEKAGYDMNKFHLISLAGTNFEIQKEIKTENKKKAFISTAFHSFIKGTHRLLLAWRRADIKDIPLLIVGNMCEDMKEFIEKYGPFENVIFVGARYDLNEWYKNYDAVGILLSLSEGAVRVTPELMSFGFPMIVSEDATCDLVKDQENGFIVNPFDEEEIAEKIKYFAQNWENVHEMNLSVLKSINNRTITDYSLEVADYLMSLGTNLDKEQ